MWTKTSSSTDRSTRFCPIDAFLTDDKSGVIPDVVIQTDHKESDPDLKQGPAKVRIEDLSSSDRHISAVSIAYSMRSKSSRSSKFDPFREKWLKLIEEHDDTIKETERNILVNKCALEAIKELVYDYFYETFQFTITKFALMNQHNMISQKVNSTWNVPKVLRTEIKTPKPKKEKKPKTPKKPKKKEKKSKKSKSDKKSKKSKSTKSKGSKAKKKHKLSKEAKAELVRLKKEQRLLEEEKRKAEENRRLLFPLNDATDDNFFRNIFTNWVKPKKDKKAGRKSGKKRK